MAYKHKLSLILILFTLLVWPVLMMAQTATTIEPKRQNAAEAINVKLQVPLPFVPLTCKDKEGNPAVCKLTDYIAGMYRLLVGLGALFAVVMFIIAGYQWIFAGGSADKIGAAKKRIMGAVIGLILALLSYVILNSISARLVELRLPLVDPVPGIYFLGGESCQTSQELANLEQKQNPPIPTGKLKLNLQTSDPDAPAIFTRDAALCGQKYTVIGANAGECSGNICTDPSESCVNNQCVPIFLYGDIEWGKGGDNLAQLILGSNGYVDKIELYAVCNNDDEPRDMNTTSYERSIKKVGPYSISRDHMTAGKTDFEEYKQMGAFKPKDDFGTYSGNPNVYNITQYQRSFRDCVKNNGGFKGYVLEVEVNDDDGSWHNILPTIDDDFAVGKACSQALAQTKADGTSILDFNNLNFKEIQSSQLFQVEDFNTGFQCDLNITRATFPDR